MSRLTALDVIVQAHVLELVRSLHRQIRSAIVFVSHNLAAVAQLADRIGVLYAGELMELGPAAQVLDHPSNPYTRGLIAAVPRIGARRLPRGIPGTASREPLRFDHCVFLERCALAADPCRTTRPALVELGAGDHVSRCHFAAEPSRVEGGPAERAMRVTDEGADNAATLLEVSGLSVEYRRGAGFLGLGRPHVVRAVREVSFRLPRRRVLAVVGESGSGKSTLARALLRLEPKTGGGSSRGGGCPRPRRRSSARLSPPGPDRVPEPDQLPPSPQAGGRHRGPSPGAPWRRP
jgi:peptide/nickel transport system ATP-binding protein